jgi:hypothetical protein
MTNFDLMEDTMKWESMETAPRDGREILTCNTNIGGFIRLISWNTIHKYWQSKGEPILSLHDTHWTPILNVPKKIIMEDIMKEAPKFINKCYKCKHRGEVMGSHHSTCNHPEVANDKQDSLAGLMAIFASVGRVPAVNVGTEKLNIKANAHGIKSGWFNWPFNFDPVWLESCNGYEEKGSASE